MNFLFRAGSLLGLVALSSCGGGGTNLPAVPIPDNQTVPALSSVANTLGQDRQSQSIGSVAQSSANTIAINAGGSDTGNWISDADYNTGSAARVSNTIDTGRVTNPAPQAVYQSQRYAANLTYTIPRLTPYGNYSVRLDFVESFFNQTGQRVFDVRINGAKVLGNFDILGAAGAMNVAIAKQFNTTADSSGIVTIAFSSSVNYATIAGIEVTAGSGSIVPTPAPTSGPSGSGGWPQAGWVPYSGGPLTARVPSNPSFTSNSSTIVDTLWSGRSSDAGQLQVYSGPPPPSNADYSADVLYFGHSGDPVYTISCYDYGGACTASGMRVHIPKGAYPAGGTDHHIDIRDTVTGKDVMLWKAPVPSGGGGNYNVGWGAAINANSNGLDAIGSTASGVSAIWSLRETDLVHNSINHAIVVSVNGESSSGYVYPAVGWDNGNFRSNYPQMGAHFWLDVPPNQLPSNCPSYAVSYLTALNKYGAYFIDSGSVSGVFGIQAESDMSYTYNGGASVWGPFMRSLGLNSSGMGQLEIDSCGINMQHHMHVLSPPSY